MSTRRKVFKQGPATLVVSLPSKWARENKINAGNELSVLPVGNSITFSKTDQKIGKKEITLNLDDFSYHFILSRSLAVLYKTGYDKITLTYSDPNRYLKKANKDIALKASIQEIVKRFVGAEIASQSATKTEIECFLTEISPDLDKISKRIFFLIKETTNEMLDAIGKDYSKFHENIYFYHDNITKFINYFLRTLYSSEKTESEKKFAFASYSYLSVLVDKLRHISARINEFGCTPQVKKYFTELFEYFYELLQCFEKREMQQELINKIYNLRNRILNQKLSVRELKVVSEARMFLDSPIVFLEYIFERILEKKEKL